MDFLSAIGRAIVEPIVRYTVQPVARQVGYVIHFKRNLQKLEARVEELRAAREGKNIEVAETQRRGEGIHPDVQLWLTKVEEITAKTDQFLKDECSQENLKCLHGFRPNLTMLHRLSRNSTKLLQEVVELHERRRQLPIVSCGVLREEACIISTGDYQAFESRRPTFKEIMDELKNPNTIRIGVYGIGGVGKTTLVKEVYRQAKQDQTKLFDDVVLVLDVKKNLNPEDLQKKIVEKLDMKISQSDDETIDGRAKRLCGRIKDKNVLVILDDVWEPIDLESVGLPSVATCKILLTSRSRKALSDMGTHKDFQLHILGEEETWVLFENKAGDVVKDPAIQTVAKQVAQNCGGLPVLVVTVASTLKNRTTLPPWKDALTCLQEGSNRDDELTEKAYLGLEWSYNQLTDKQLKPLFLLCGYAVQWNDIVLDDLLYYSVGLGFFEKPYTVERARNALYSWVEKLKDFCLLVESDDDRYVTMHDLVRNAANRIASRDPQILALVKDEDEGGLKEWPDRSFLEKCTTISLPCNGNFPSLPQVMQCPALRMFLLEGNSKPLAIAPTLFKEMKQLNVLSWINMGIGSLPQSLGLLENLRTLCLLYCTLDEISIVGQLRNLEILSFEGSDFVHLPQEIGQLAHLRLLDLSGCCRLEVISPGVISSLTSLECLTMKKSFDNWVIEGERNNASLSELEHLSHLTALVIHVPDANLLPANFFFLKLERFQIMIGKTWAWDEDEDEEDEDEGEGEGEGEDDEDDEEEEEEEEEEEDKYPFLNRLKLQLTTSIELNQGLRKLLRLCDDLSLYGTDSVNHIVHQFDNEDFQQLKHLCLRNNVDFIITKKVMLRNLKTLVVHECDNIRFLFTFSVAKSLVQLKCLEISSCKLLKEIVSSTTECGREESMGNMFPNLEVLNLKGLEKLARFCTGSYVEFPSLKELEVDDCPELRAFICENVETSTSSTQGIIIDEETDERDSKQEKDLDVNRETLAQSILFDEKVGFPRLESLVINGVLELKTIWHCQQAQDSFDTQER